VLATPETTAVGAAMLAGVGGGIFRDLDEAVELLAIVAPRTYEPNATVHDAYDEAYDRYRRLFDAVEPGFSVDERPTVIGALA
jgi:sugar (pentulose or hexulose) kinase